MLFPARGKGVSRHERSAKAKKKYGKFCYRMKQEKKRTKEKKKKRKERTETKFNFVTENCVKTKAK